MKEYANGRKATEFSKGQVGMIYANAKQGNLKIERWAMSYIYDLSEYYGYDDNRGVEYVERKVIEILDAVRGGKLEEAQELIDAFTTETFDRMGRKFQSRANHALVA